MSEATVVISSDEGAVKEQSKKRGARGWAEGYAAGWSAAHVRPHDRRPNEGGRGDVDVRAVGRRRPNPHGRRRLVQHAVGLGADAPAPMQPIEHHLRSDADRAGRWRAALPPTLKQGYVRSLGWQALPQPLDILVQAVSAALVALDTPFTLREKEYRFVIRPSQEADEMPPTPQSDSPQMGVSPSASPSPFGGHRSPSSRRASLPQDDRSGMIGETAPIQPLVIFIQLFRESHLAPRH